MKAYENFIEGKFVRGGNESQTIPVFNPSTEEEIAQVPESSEAEINRAIEAATRAQKKWAKLAAVERENTCVRLPRRSATERTS